RAAGPGGPRPGTQAAAGRCHSAQGQRSDLFTKHKSSPLHKRWLSLHLMQGGCVCYPVTASEHQVQAGQLVPQAVVDPLLCQQLVVGAVLQDALLSQDQDAVVVLDGGQAVGDGQGGAAVGQFFQALAHQDLALVVQGAGGLVQ